MSDVVECQDCGRVLFELTPGEAQRVAERPYDFVRYCGPCGRDRMREMEVPHMTRDNDDRGSGGWRMASAARKRTAADRHRALADQFDREADDLEAEHAATYRTVTR